MFNRFVSNTNYNIYKNIFDWKANLETDNKDTYNGPQTNANKA